MREFYQVINEYPWTTVLLGIFVIILISIIFFKESK